MRAATGIEAGDNRAWQRSSALCTTLYREDQNAKLPTERNKILAPRKRSENLTTTFAVFHAFVTPQYR